MKRSSKYKNRAKPYYSYFFWKPCCYCKQEFRRERGFVKEAGLQLNKYGVSRYLCGTCADTVEKAEEIYATGPWIPSMPKCPPPAPMPRKKHCSEC